MYLLNAIAANMLPAGSGGTLAVRPLLGGAKHAGLILVTEGFTSAVGHDDTAAVFAEQLGLPVEAARVTVTLRPGDKAILGAYRGPRLPVGATTLPEGAVVEWYAINVARSTPVPAPTVQDYARYGRDDDTGAGWFDPLEQGDDFNEDVD